MSESISVRAPLRVSLGGGGTDLPSYFTRHGGFVVSAAIDRYVRLTVEPPPSGEFELDHLEREQVAATADIRHPILRAAISRHGNGPVRLVSRGDVAPGTGLGSSGAYTVSAIKALELAAGRDPSPAALAAAACVVELDDVGRTVGKQDQYAASFGGVNAFTFSSDGSVEVRRLELSAQTRAGLGERFLLFSTGARRSAAEMLAGQVERNLVGDPDLRRNLKASEGLARAVCGALERGDLDAVGELMNEQWALKRERLVGTPVAHVERLRAAAFRGGARGAILTGAGGGGYVLAYARDPAALRVAMEQAGAPELSFDLDDSGCVAQL